MKKETRESLEGVDWNIVALKLARYAKYKLERISWRKDSVVAASLSDMVMDVVMAAITDVLDGKRNWNPSEEPDILNHLRSIVNSKINHMYKAREYETTDRYKETNNGESPEELLKQAEPSSEHASHITRQNLNPEEELIHKENEEQISNRFMEATDGDDDLDELVNTIMCGIVKPKEIAEHMGKPVKDIYNLLKRLRRNDRNLRTKTAR